MHRISKSTTKILKNFNINKLNLKIMKVYKFESKNCLITLELTNSKDNDYFKGTYRVTQKDRKNGHIWDLAYFDWSEEANNHFLKLISDWVK